MALLIGILLYGSVNRHLSEDTQQFTIFVLCGYGLWSDSETLLPI